ncbi:MAG: histidine phosphatase family protein [Deltaproteobacteria bacterium]|nr:histidine phosphatase family protein [Deltaproteobacteria bacterium]MBW2072247.1 histidine phosphatase family protein [Deltaproteobacteria bacterium]
MTDRAKEAPSGKCSRAYLVRHGVTAHNKLGIFTGWGKEPLDEQGVQQARRLARAFVGIRLAAFYTSPVARALQTAEIIAYQLPCQVLPDSDLGELRIPMWEGLSSKTIQALYPEQFHLWQRQPARLSMPGMEDLATLQKRIVGWLERKFQEHAGADFAAVSHMGPIRVAMLHYLGLSLEHYRENIIANAAVVVFIKKSVNQEVIVEGPYTGGCKRQLLSAGCSLCSPQQMRMNR